jgi:peptidyl-prolyl cis-trans isomerase SurA
MICLVGFLLATGSAPVFAAEPLNRIVAFVNNEIITLHELNTKIKEMTGMTPVQLKSRGEATFQDARQQILELMIDQKITEAKIKELGIKVTQKQVDEAVERIKSDNRWTQEDLLAGLKKEGVTPEKFMERVKKDLERIHLINSEVKSKIIITDERIRKYYEEHKAKYAGDVKLHLAGIVLLRKNSGAEENERLLERGEEILQLLKRGEDFAELAKRYSEGPGANEGGDLGSFRISQLEPELQKILNDMPIGGNSGLIERRNGIQIVKLLKREGGEGRNLEDVKGSIYSAIYQEEVNDRYMTWIKELRERSYTKIIF